MCNDNVLPLAIILTALYANNKPFYSYPTCNSYGGMDKSTVGMLNETLSQTCCQRIDTADLYIDSLANAQVQHIQVQRWMQDAIQQPTPFKWSSFEHPTKLPSLVERLDKAIFPEDPIRDWTEHQVEAIDKHFDKLLECLQNV